MKKIILLIPNSDLCCPKSKEIFGMMKPILLAQCFRYLAAVHSQTHPTIVPSYILVDIEALVKFGITFTGFSW